MFSGDFCVIFLNSNSEDHILTAATEAYFRWTVQQLSLNCLQQAYFRAMFRFFTPCTMCPEQQIVEESIYLHFEMSYGSQWDHFENAVKSLKV